MGQQANIPDTSDTQTRRHAVLSASGAEKWFNCPPSARLEETLPDTESEYAKEGTLAHSFAELFIGYNLLGLPKQAYTVQLKKLQADPLYKPEMLEHTGNFAAFVADVYLNAKKATSDACLSSEQRLDFSRYVPEGFGTGDVVIASDGVLHIIDFKYGEGVKVSAENNMQMKLYALGALQAYELLYDIDVVRMTIFQPRLDNISEWEITVHELLSWAETELKPRARLAFYGEGNFCPGEHCTSHFCKAAVTCRARKEKMLEMAKYDFADPPLLSDDEIADILLTAKELEKWAKGIWDYAQTQALSGKHWPNFKLVEGRSSRTYTQRDKIIQVLTNNGFELDKIAPRELLGITEMEKVISKKSFSELLTNKGCVVKPPGKPTLVPMTDSRPELVLQETAAEAFDDDFDYGTTGVY